MIFLATRFVARTVDTLLQYSQSETGDGGGWLHPDTVDATRQIARVLIWLFAIVVAYPYIPGSSTTAFKGVSVFAGLVLSLGSSGLVNQILSGILLTYARALRVRATWCQVGETFGVVTEIGRPVDQDPDAAGRKRSRSPTHVVGSTSVINYAREGRLVSTSVTIGYNAPWRQVALCCSRAAERTPGIRREPPPFVLQRALSDFYVEYELRCALERQLDRSRCCPTCTRRSRTRSTSSASRSCRPPSSRSRKVASSCPRRSGSRRRSAGTVASDSGKTPPTTRAPRRRLRSSARTNPAEARTRLSLRRSSARREVCEVCGGAFVDLESALLELAAQSRRREARRTAVRRLRRRLVTNPSEGRLASGFPRSQSRRVTLRPLTPPRPRWRLQPAAGGDRPARRRGPARRPPAPTANRAHRRHRPDGGQKENVDPQCSPIPSAPDPRSPGRARPGTRARYGRGDPTFRDHRVRRRVR